MLTKENVLSKISPNQIYSHYLGISDLKAKIHSPFTDDKNASFKVYQNGSFKCFSSGYQGDCLQFVAYKFSFDCKSEFHKVLSQINKDFELGIEVSHDNEFQVAFKNYTDFALSYWKDLNIDIELLNKYDVKFVDKFQFRFNDQLKEFKVFPGVLAFDYVVDSRHEIYFPSQPIKKVKKQFYKNQIKSDIFGLKQLPEHSENLIICAGKKDTLVTISFGFSAVSFQSEAIFPDPNIIRSLKEKCTNLLICYDNDEAGIKQSKKIAERFNLPIINLPEGFNDIADYLPTHKSEAFKQLIEKSLSEHVSLNNSPVWVHKFNYYKKEKNVTILLANFIIKVIALISSDTVSYTHLTLPTSDLV